MPNQEFRLLDRVESTGARRVDIHECPLHVTSLLFGSCTWHIHHSPDLSGYVQRGGKLTENDSASFFNGTLEHLRRFIHSD